MKKILKEEIDRIKYLCTPKNNNLLMEALPPDDLVRLGRKLFPIGLWGHSDDFLKKFIKHLDVYDIFPAGHNLKGMTSDDIAKGIISGTIKGKDLGDIHILMIKDINTPFELKDELMTKIVKSKGFKELAKKGDVNSLRKNLEYPPSGDPIRTFNPSQTDDLIKRYIREVNEFKIINSADDLLRTGNKTSKIIGKVLALKTLFGLGLVGGALYYAWKELVKNSEIKIPKCIEDKVTVEDTDKMKDKGYTDTLIQKTGIGEIDILGGGLFGEGIDSGSFRTADSSTKGEWKKKGDNIVIIVDEKEYSLGCTGIDTKTEPEIKIPKTPLDIEIEEWESEGAKYEECKSPPYKLGCTDSKYYDEIELIQKCTGYSPVDGRFTPEFLKFLVKNNYPKSLTRSNVEFIAQNCKPIKMR